MGGDDKRGTRVVPDVVPVPRDADLDDVATYIPQAASEEIVAYLEITGGAGTGVRLPIRGGTNAIGREPDKNRIVLNFGDQSISREGHAVITADGSPAAFTLYDGGKTNPVTLNGAVLSGHAPLTAQDSFCVGATQLRIILP